MPLPKRSSAVRRSVALPKRVVDEASAVAPSELKGNLNGLVTVALTEFTAPRRAMAFERAMEQMAADPAIRKENAAIERAFRGAESDGLDS